MCRFISTSTDGGAGTRTFHISPPAGYRAQPILIGSLVSRSGQYQIGGVFMNGLGRFVNQPKSQFHQHLTSLATSTSNSTPTPFTNLEEEEVVVVEHEERLMSSMASPRSMSPFLPKWKEVSEPVHQHNELKIFPES